MNELLRIGATAGAIGFVTVGVFALLWVAVLALIGLAGWIAQKIGGGRDD